MIKNERVFHSFKEIGEAYARENKETVEKQKLLRSYGVDIPFEYLSNIEIVSKDK